MKSCKLIKIERILKTKGKEGSKSWKTWHEWEVTKTAVLETNEDDSSEAGEMYKNSFWTLG